MTTVAFTIEVDPVREREHPYLFRGRVKLGSRVVYETKVGGKTFAVARSNMIEKFGAKIQRLLEES